MQERSDEHQQFEAEIVGLKEAVVASGEIIFMTEPDGLITYVNPSFCAAYGYGEEEVVGRVTPRILKSGEISVEEYDRYWKALVKGELVNKTKDGDLITVDNSANPIRDEEGRVLGFLAIQRDVTERKRAEAALRESEDRFHRLSRAAFEGIAISDAGKVVDVNDRLAKMLGYDPAEMIGKDAMAFVASESRDLVRENIASGHEGPYVHYSLRKDGSTIPVEVQAKALPFEGRSLRVTAISDISDRMRIREQLLLQSAALEATANAIMITDAEGIVIWVNPAFTALTGYDAQEAKAKEPSLLYSGKRDKSSYGDLLSTIRSGGVWRGQRVNRRKDGSKYIDERTITPVRNHRGEITNYIAVIQDISARVRAEMELRRLKEFNENIVQNATEGITIQDMDGNFTFVNPAIASQLGYEPEELLGSHWTTIIAPEQRPLVEAADKRRVEGAVDRYELEISGKDGASQPFLVSGSPWYKDTQFAGTMAVFTNISERVQRERERDTLVRVSASLRKTGSRAEIPAVILHQLVELMGVEGAALSFRDQQGDESVVELAVEAWQSWSGRRIPPGKGVCGRVITTGKPYVNNDMKSDEELFRADLFDKTPAVTCVPMIEHEEVIGALWVGRRKPFQAGEVSILTAVGDMAANAIQRSALHERTQSHAMELEQRVIDRTKALAQANAQLKQLDRLKSKFVSDVSHELRTPITNLNLYLDLLTRGKPDQHPRYMAVLRREANRLGRLVEDILSLSRLEMSRGRELKFSTVDLNDVAEQVITAHRPRAEAAELSLIFEPFKQPVLVFGERNQLAQVVTNLVANAINYTDAGHVKVCTLLNGQRGQGCLQVEDTGRGIDEEDLPHLFERFYRGNSTGQLDIPGTGLGLAIVAEIVELHGGQVEVESRIERGTVFRAWLPMPVEPRSKGDETSRDTSRLGY